MEKKSKLIIKIISLIFIVIGIIEFIILLCYYNKNDYKMAKKECISFLNDNLEELNSLAEEEMTSKSDRTKTYKNKSYNYYKELSGKEYIQFAINAQGMLGGQYWGIIYSPNNDLLNGKDIEIYDEKEYRKDGNNIFIKEKIKDNWYFYYDDFDGHVDINKLQK